MIVLHRTLCIKGIGGGILKDSQYPRNECILHIHNHNGAEEGDEAGGQLGPDLYLKAQVQGLALLFHTHFLLPRSCAGFLEWLCLSRCAVFLFLFSDPLLKMA